MVHVLHAKPLPTSRPVAFYSKKSEIGSSNNLLQALANNRTHGAANREVVFLAVEAAEPSPIWSHTGAAKSALDVPVVFSSPTEDVSRYGEHRHSRGHLNQGHRYLAEPHVQRDPGDGMR